MKKLGHKNIREIKLIQQAINSLGVDLTEKVVLTEVGSGPYMFAPIIPALANAKKVFAWCRDSKFGSASEIIAKCGFVAKELDLTDKIEFFDGEINIEHLQRADIITNSGFLRPLNLDKLMYARNDVVVPLMYETWEFRSRDIDLDYCTSRGIKVAGTWENHPSLKIFSGVGTLAIKLILESGMEVYQNNILVWSDDQFGEETAKALYSCGANNVQLTTDLSVFYNTLSTLDTLYLCDYDESRPYFGNHGIFDLNIILAENPSLTIVHLYGEIDYDELENTSLNVYPTKNGSACTMSETLAYLGPNLMINLQTAGLKVAQCMVSKLTSELVQPMNY